MLQSVAMRCHFLLSAYPDQSSDKLPNLGIKETVRHTLKIALNGQDRAGGRFSDKTEGHHLEGSASKKSRLRVKFKLENGAVDLTPTMRAAVAKIKYLL